MHISPALYIEGYELRIRLFWCGVSLYQRSSSADIENHWRPNLQQEACQNETVRDKCTKTVFRYNDKLWEQTDNVSMGGSLGPVVANIIFLFLLIYSNLITQMIKAKN